MIYEIFFLTEDKNDKIRCEVMEFKAKVKKLIRRDEFPNKEFRKYLEDRNQNLTPNQLYQFTLGKTANKEWLNCLKGYYEYIKEFGYYPKDEEIIKTK